MTNKIDQFAGDTLNVTVPLVDEDGNPLVGVARAWFGVKESKDALAYVYGPVEGVVNATTAEFAVPVALTEDLDPQTAYYACRCLKNNGDVHTVLKDAYELLWPVIDNADMT